MTRATGHPDRMMTVVPVPAEDDGSCRATRTARSKRMPDETGRTVLPIPDRPHSGLTTYDAKDPDTAFPPIQPLRPTEGRTERARDPHRRRASALRRRSAAVPDADVREARRQRAQVQPLSHDGALLADPRQALLTGRNHHAVGMGGITEIATSAPGYPLRPNSAALRSQRR